MKSKLLATRPINENGSDFLESLRSDNPLASGFGFLAGPAPQSAVGPVPQNLVPPTISLTASGVAYSQNFDSLSNTAGSTTNVLGINGWDMIETGGGARDNDQYAVDTGGSTTGDTFSYGSAPGGIPSAERALGQLRSGTLIPTFGAAFTNNTGQTITSLAISYDGEQWRFGGVHSTTPDKMDFQISFDATSLTTGTWSDVNALDFLPPVTAGTAGALDGNNALNRVANISSVLSSLTIASGATFWIRWVDQDASGGDDGLAIDNFSITPTTGGGGEAQTVQFDPVSVTQAEGNSGTTAYTFTITRTGGTTGQLDFSGTIAAGGTDSADFVGGVAPTTFSGSILAGQTSATVTVNVQGDFTIEGDESFTLTITNATNTDGGVTVTIGANDDGTGTITNDDAAGTISVGDVTMTEGDSGTTAGSFAVTRTGGASGTVSVDYLITLPGGVGGADGSDVSGTLSGTITFLEGETSATIPFSVNGDVTNEPDETFTVALSNPQGGATIGDGSGTATITNDDAPPTISIGDASLVEGDDGVTYLVFTVTLSKVSVDPVTVDYQTADVSAVDGSDYLGLTGQVSFAPGDTSETISVPLIGDTAPENNETLTVTLSNPSGATISDGSATGTITNDDGAQYYSLASGSFTQDWTNTGQITANDNWSGVPYIIGYLGDIDAGSTTNIDARTLTGASLGAIDVIANLANTTSVSGGVGEFHIADPVVGLQGSGTADAPSLVLYMDATGRSGVRLQANLRDIDSSAPGGIEDNSAQQINVQYRTSPTGTWTNVPGAYFADVTALGASQVTALDVTLPAGADNAATLEIRIMTTNAGGSDEWVGIDDIVVSSQVSTPSLSIANAAVIEGDAGPTIITFTVTRSGDSNGAVTADWTAVFGTGPFDAEGDDFTVATPLSGQVAFADGQTSATITLSVDGDVGPEVDENFTIQLSNPSGATITDGTATGTIVNDDGAPPLVTINDVTVTEGDSGTVLMTFTVTRTGGTGAFDVDWATADGSATAPGDYAANGGTISFAAGQMSDTVTVAVSVNGDTDSELSETLQVTLSNPTNFAVITDAVGIGTIASDDPIYIHDIQGTAYFSPILAAEGINSFNSATVGTVIVRAVVTAVDNDGTRQGFYLQEELADWDANPFTSEGIFVMTRNDAGVGSAVSGVAVGDIVTVTAHVMEYQGFSSNMPITALTSPTSIVVVSSGNALPTFTLGAMPTAIMTSVQPDHTDSADGAGDTFDASLYALSYWETVEGMLVTVPDLVVADGFVTTSGGQPIFQAYSQSLTDADQINDRGGLTIAGDPPIGPPDTAETVDDTTNGGRALTDGDINPDIIEVDFSGFAIDAPAGLGDSASMGDYLGDVTGIIDFDFTDRKLFVTDWNTGQYVDNTTTQDTTALGNDSRALTVATFNVENLDPGDGAARFTALANAIATNLNAPDIICIEEMQDNNGATSSGGADASTTWQMLVDALNLATGSNYQWVDQEPNGSEGGEPGGNIRVGFLYNTDRVQLGDLDASATLTERRQYTDRIGDGVRDAGDLIAFDDSMLGAEIQTGDWSNTRRSLLGEFTFNGNTVYVTANHWPAKSGSDDFWEFNQNPAAGEPTNSGWTQRNNVAQDVYAMLDLIETGAPGSGIVSGGDYNDFYFYRPMTTVTGYTMADGTARVGGSRFDNLTLTLPEAERYTYNFDGRSQAIDHIVVDATLSAVATYDVVHLNTGFNSGDSTPLSDHDPGLSSFDFRSFSEILTGGAGADLIDGFGGDDTIRGLGGNDALVGGAGDDTMEGGQGDDTYYVQDSGDVVVEAAGEGTDRVAAAISYALAAGAEVEILEAITLGDTAALDLAGNEFANLVIGNAGANFLSGGGGNDVLVGLGGVDVLLGGSGNDSMSGGSGNDTYYVQDAGDIVNEAAGDGIDRIAATVSYALDASTHVEILEAITLGETTALHLAGNDFANLIIGNDGSNLLSGAGGDDILIALGGDDLLHGGAGDDAMHGGAGNDSYYVQDAGDVVNELAGQGSDRVATSVSYALAAGTAVETIEAITQSASTAIDLAGNELANLVRGNAGVNVLDGKNGDDVLIGLGGADTFAFTTALGAGNVDVIEDFQSGSDTIALDDAVFAGLAPGALGAGAFVVGSSAQDADDRIVYDSATGALYFDADGNGAGAAVQFATLNHLPALAASDFVVI